MSAAAIERPGRRAAHLPWSADPAATRPPLPAGTTDLVLEELFPKPHPYAADPIGYCRDVLCFDPWSKQREILEALRDHNRVAVRSCHGVGKTAGAAAGVIWFHDVFRNSRVISTAPTFSPGVKDLLWREIRALKARAGDRIPSSVYDVRLERGEQWFAEGYSTDKPERFSGHHAEHVLFVVDEASGVVEEIFEAGEGFLTSENTKVLLIGNPTQLSGQFHRAFHSERHLWKTIHISAYDAPCFTGEPVSEEAARKLITRAWVDDKVSKWGEDSPVFQVRVKGDFASTADNTVCSLAEVEKAVAHEAAPVPNPAAVIVDVARYGSDETVIGVRLGRQLRITDSYMGKDLMETAGRVYGTALQVFREVREQVTIVVDDTGLGGGVTDRLRELVYSDPEARHFRIAPFNGAEQALDPAEYPNRRSEAWFALSEQLADVDLPYDEMLLGDLVAPRYKIDSQNRRVVEPKDETKKRLGRSPDRGDLAVMAFSIPPEDRSTPREPVDRGRAESLTGDLMERRF